MKDTLLQVAHFVAVVALIAVVVRFANRRLVRYFESRPHDKFRQQLYQVSGLLVIVLFAILSLPIDDELRGDLLNLYGLIVTATIALSSTTLVGNVLAGITLKIIGNCRPGKYITVGEHFGRITEMDLLHTEIQTEDRDLTTLPNMFLITHPVRVMRSSGTVLSVELSLGYDVSRHAVDKLLTQAAADSGLETPYVQIRHLGDYSVTYRVCGLLREVNRLLDKRRELRARTIDSLHRNGIEIVSPSFMNTRAYDPNEVFVGEVGAHAVDAERETVPDTIVFDKAEKAESVEKLRENLQAAEDRLKACDKTIADPESDDAFDDAVREREEVQLRIERLRSIIDRKEARISDD